MKMTTQSSVVVVSFLVKISSSFSFKDLISHLDRNFNKLCLQL